MEKLYSKDDTILVKSNSESAYDKDFSVEINHKNGSKTNLAFDDAEDLKFLYRKLKRIYERRSGKRDKC